MIKSITTEDLRTMRGKEGLVLQGCGGEPQEWLNGINNLFTEEKLLLDGTEFTEISVFRHRDRTCILFPFGEQVRLDMGRLAIWRLTSYDTFGGTWLSDYVPNNLGGYTDPVEPKQKSKPDCPLIGQDGNVFNLIGIAARTLRRNGMTEEAKKMTERAHTSKSYSEAIGVIMDYVNVVSIDDEEDEDDEFFKDDPLENDDWEEDCSMGSI